MAVASNIYQALRLGLGGIVDDRLSLALAGRTGLGEAGGGGGGAGGILGGGLGGLGGGGSRVLAGGSSSTSNRTASEHDVHPG